MVAIKPAHVPIHAKDLWPGLPWDWNDEREIRDKIRQQLAEQGITNHIELIFAEARAWQEYMNQFPRYGEREKIVAKLNSANQSLVLDQSDDMLTDEDLQYMVNKLFGVNDQYGCRLKEKMERMLKDV